MHQRALKDARTPEKLKRHRSLLGTSQIPMEEKKRKIIRNLRKLESLGLVSSNNQYQDIINMIAKVNVFDQSMDAGQGLPVCQEQPYPGRRVLQN